MNTTYKGRNGLLTRNGVSLLVPFIMITACFSLWGFTNDMTTTIVSAFSKIFRMNMVESSMVNFSNYFGYFIMAIPAALFIRRFHFKAGVVLGLGIYALGALLFFPAKAIGAFPAFLLAYFVMTCGLAFLETSCHPFIYSLGSEDGGIIRLNLAQAFNALGAVIGMFVARDVVQAGMSQLSRAERMSLPPEQFEIVKNNDLSVLIQPYLIISVFIILLMLVIIFKRITADNDKRSTESLRSNVHEILSLRNYREGVLTEFFYVGAQVACWTFMLQDDCSPSPPSLPSQPSSASSSSPTATGSIASCWLAVACHSCSPPSTALLCAVSASTSSWPVPDSPWQYSAAQYSPLSRPPSSTGTSLSSAYLLSTSRSSFP